jgi:hypothetical protein
VLERLRGIGFPEGSRCENPAVPAETPAAGQAARVSLLAELGHADGKHLPPLRQFVLELPEGDSLRETASDGEH